MFSDENPNADLRFLLHKAKAETDVRFVEIAAAIGLSKESFSHFTRNNPKLPNAERQEAIFCYLRDAYREAGISFRLTLKQAG